MSEESNGRRWTVMVYMAADTGDTFYHEAMKNITEMTRATFDDNRIKVLVHADAPSPWLRKCWKVASGQALSEPCGHNCLLDFVEGCVKNYPASYYLLVLWGHGEGIDWKKKILAGREGASKIIGVGKRFGQGSESVMEVGEIGKTLKQLHEAIKKLDLHIKPEQIVIGFDACLMAMVEVYYEIHEYVGKVVAANDEIPDTGWPYREILTRLSADLEPSGFAEAIAQECTRFYSEKCSESDVSFSVCNLDAEVCTSLVDTVKALKTKLDVYIKADGGLKVIRKARDFAEDLKEKAYIDLNVFCSELRTELGELGTAAGDVAEVLDKFVTKPYFSDEYPQKYAKHSRAVSICFPESADLEGSIPGIEIDWRSYQDLEFSKKTEWSRFWNDFWRKPGVE